MRVLLRTVLLLSAGVAFAAHAAGGARGGGEIHGGHGGGDRGGGSDRGAHSDAPSSHGDTAGSHADTGSHGDAGSRADGGSHSDATARADTSSHGDAGSADGGAHSEGGGHVDSHAGGGDGHGSGDSGGGRSDSGSGSGGGDSRGGSSASDSHGATGDSHGGSNASDGHVGSSGGDSHGGNATSGDGHNGGDTVSHAGDGDRAGAAGERASGAGDTGGKTADAAMEGPPSTGQAPAAGERVATASAPTVSRPSGVSVRPPIERDRQGFERRSGEVLLVGAAGDIASVRGAGYEVLSQSALQGGQVLVRLRVRDGSTVDGAIAALRLAAPGAVVGANHLYRPAAGRSVAQAGPAPIAAPRGRNLLGLIDTGADLTQPQLAGAVQASRGFGARGYAPGEHGAEVAAIAAQAGLRLVIADVFDLDAHGEPVASADTIARAIDWMVREGVPVINISIAGPANDVLGEVIARAAAKGHVIVAAAGNNGPSGPPAYPAAYAGAVGVTAIDGRKQVYWKANRGKYIAFAAPGVALPVEVAGRRMVVSGTSFSAPLVAAAFARRMSAPSPSRAAEVLKELEATAEDLGAPGWDPVYGWGRIKG